MRMHLNIMLCTEYREMHNKLQEKIDIDIRSLMINVKREACCLKFSYTRTGVNK